MRDSVDLAVVGAGAAGLVAAISAARRGDSVAILERLPWPGKKLLATGGGRCNLLNEGLSPSAFTSTDPGLVAAVLNRFGRAEIRAFFEELGLRFQTDEAGRVYPMTNQAASVLKVLELEMRRLGVGIETRFEVERIDATAGRFRIRASDDRHIEARSIVLAGGGKSYPALGSNGSCYGLAAALGHTIVRPVPSAVPLVVRDRMCHFLQGQKMRVRAESRVGGETRQKAEGELLFAQYGLSGPAILDISESLSIALNREGRKDVSVVVDFLPDMSTDEVARELGRRLEAGWAADDLTSGLLPEKFTQFMSRIFSQTGTAPGEINPSVASRNLASMLKEREYHVQATRSWNEAEFTSGGVDAREVKTATLESKLRRGLYFAGEVLDIQGGRGGYNLAWAWASGFVAGLAE